MAAAIPANYGRPCIGPPEARWAEEPPRAQGKRAFTADKAPTFKQRVRSYFGAREQWKAAGEPVRPIEQRALIEARCKQCPSGKYSAKPVLPLMSGGTCQDCGCGIHAERNLLNAAAWSTYKCLRGHWDDLPIDFVDPPQPPTAGT
jgi:hypothetical protein